ncbi:hypothetical protein [Nocardioides kribbensis]|uniref:Uncharacterized protein n=1 Tax=Nocardioides kribbensis TaxID=305517 RepID=A0ABV1P2I0_9ACTN
MPTIDLSNPPPPAANLLDALPRRVALTLAELHLVAEAAGGAPLPFAPTPAPAAGPGGLDGRLGSSRGTTEDAAYASALSSLHDPEASLGRRGLLAGGEVDSGLLGAVGLLATPAVALDVDLAVGPLRCKAWHRQTGDAVATLATADGIVFELAWFPITQWAMELARVSVVPEDLALSTSQVPAVFDAPFALVDAAGEAVRSGRSDLLPVLVAQHTGRTRSMSRTGADERWAGRQTTLDDAATVGALGALTTEARGRLRALVADVSGASTSVVGVVSWVLLADGWRALRPRHVDDEHRVGVHRVEPPDLAAELAPVLAEVTR